MSIDKASFVLPGLALLAAGVLLRVAVNWFKRSGRWTRAATPFDRAYNRGLELAVPWILGLGVIAFVIGAIQWIASG